ncbi:hypothetical protein J1N35_025695 [Gossypium stocksii]|uniref:WAT1-related protein n=1 Tax=Gossypium stocksii TaxID=47602 RepID=A0A9D3ZXE5_9ROSI|nr:hypothetical protein J1N35_025695 [Gossypium stocksii]
MKNCVIIGVRYNSPALASTLANLIPASTILLVVIFRSCLCGHTFAAFLGFIVLGDDGEEGIGGREGEGNGEEVCKKVKGFVIGGGMVGKGEGDGRGMENGIFVK